jgi:hypothetical protein
MDPDVDQIHDSHIDDVVRRALPSSPGAAERIVSAAMGAADLRRARSSSRLIRPAVAAAMGLLIVAVAIGGSMWWRGEKPVPAPRGTITNEGDVIIITMPGSPITLIGPGAETSTVPAGTASVTLLGEPQ